MITITVFRSAAGVYKGFVCEGHAGYANRGKDIVCASVSTLVINTINSIEAFCHQAFECAEEKDSIRLELTASPTKETTLLLDSMVFGLQAIEQESQERYLKVECREV